MLKERIVEILDNFFKWKAVQASSLKLIKKELEDEKSFKTFCVWFEQTAAQELLEARALVPEHMWEGYKLLGTQGLAEQKIFYTARKKMLDQFRDRYINKKEAEGATQEGGVKENVQF